MIEFVRLPGPVITVLTRFRRGGASRSPSYPPINLPAKRSLDRLVSTSHEFGELFQNLSPQASRFHMAGEPIQNPTGLTATYHPD